MARSIGKSPAPNKLDCRLAAAAETRLSSGMTAFKEWAIVCDALGAGSQCILLRKGGIAEGRDGFQFKHREFYLFPTFFHEQLGRTKLPPGTPEPTPTPGRIELRQFARMEWSATITNREILPRLAPFHILHDDVIAERFAYDEPAGINLACVRVYNLTTPTSFPDESKYGGCRSWVELPEIESAMSPAINDITYRNVSDELRAIVG